MTVALFWDIDGTLLTTGRAGIIAFERAVRDVCGVSVDLNTLPTAGLTDSQVAERVLAAAGADAGAAPEVLATYERYLPECLPLREGHVMDGVTEILDDLKADPQIAMGLLTGNTRQGARAKLTHYGLYEYFDGVGAFCDGLCSREEIARRAHAQVDGSVVYVIGDTPHDVSCGKAIGARTVAVATGTYSSDELAASGADIVLERLPDAPHFRELLGLDVTFRP